MQSANKMCVALLFGGMSSEHEVSCVSVSYTHLDVYKRQVLLPYRAGKAGPF